MGVVSLKHNQAGGTIAADVNRLFSVLRTRRTKVFTYGFMVSFILCTGYIAFCSSSGGRSPLFDGLFVTASNSTTTYHAQLSYFISHFFSGRNGTVEGSVESQKSGDLGTNQTTVAIGSRENGTSDKNRTSSSVGSGKGGGGGGDGVLEKKPPGVQQNAILEKNQTTSGGEISQKGVSEKNQTFLGGESSKQNGTLVENRSSEVNTTTAVISPASNPVKNQTKQGSSSSAVQSNTSPPPPVPTQKGVLEGSKISNSSTSPVKGSNTSPPLASAGSDDQQQQQQQKKKNWSIDSMKKCNIFHGRWVEDDSYPLYPEGSCPHIDEPFDCFLNGRPDRLYQKLRWQPHDCNIPRLNATDMLERLRGKRLVFVGDSLNRNMWESLVCILRNSVKNKKKVSEASGRHEFRTEGSYSFLFKDYGCTVEFFRSPFLVQEWEMPDTNGTKKETLRLDIIERSSSKYKNADVIVFNTGHWWTHDKTSKGKDYYQEGNRVYSELNVVEAFHKALNTWARWVDVNINPKKTLVFFRGYSSSHFSGGQWNSGGQCDSETDPIKNETYLAPYPPKMNVLESVLTGMKTPVSYLNITRMTDYRKDAHPSIYRKPKLTEADRRSPDRFQDCSHWCLPGVPDSWNELLYAQLLIKQHQLQ